MALALPSLLACEGMALSAAEQQGALVLPEVPYDYTPELPAHFRGTVGARIDNSAANPTTDEGATLGRVLFYDQRLSANGTIACASCHQPASGFSDPRPLSAGFEGALTDRNSMPTINVRFYGPGSMFWDQRSATLEDQVLQPFQSPVEMGMTLEELVARVESFEEYPALFTAAFGDPFVSSERISVALAQFTRSVIATQSRWDEGIVLARGDIRADFPNFTAQENAGKAIFFGRGHCGNCHMAGNPTAVGPAVPPPGDNLAFFQMAAPADNGLPDPADDGVGGVTGRPQDIGVFKSPSLRNVAQTAPYMHDGRFATLEQVVAFYDRAIAPTRNLHPQLRGPDGAPIRLGLGPAGSAALVAFLRTLTDDTLATDPRFSDPFEDVAPPAPEPDPDTTPDPPPDEPPPPGDEPPPPPPGGEPPPPPPPGGGGAPPPP